MAGRGDVTRQHQDWHWTVVDKQNESVEVIGIQSEKLSRYLERLHTAGLNVTRVLPDGCYLPGK